MKRRTMLLVTPLLFSCGRQQSSFESVLPADLAGGWQRTALTSPASNPPDLIEKLGVDSSAEAAYEGSSRVLVKAYRMRSETGAFEAMQKWRQSDGTGLHKGAYFFVGSGTSQSDVMGVLAALQAEPRR